MSDPLGGYADLVARRVRFIGDAQARIREDYLRILRFFRFAAEYAVGSIDTAGLSACGVLRDGLQQLSAERIRTEVLKTLQAPRAAEIAELMHAHGFWVPLLGLAPVPAQLARLIDTAPESDPTVRLAALCVVTPEDARRLSARLRLSNVEALQLDAMAELSARIGPEMVAVEVRRAIYARGRETFLSALAIAVARQGHATGWHGTDQRQAALAWPSPVFPVRGQDLLDRGVAPGPAIGESLRRLEAWWIEQDFVPDRRAVLARLGASG